MNTEGTHTLASGLYFDLHVDYARSQIDVEGGLDVACAPNLATAVAGLQRAGAGDITIRLDRVTFLDMAGVGILVGAQASQTDRGLRLSVDGVNPQLRRIFTLGGVSHLLATDERVG